ncbi:hypothetical protein GCM10008949_16800 [Deinococcus humi]|nr:hypothetical protein GCM10008949_16800 [Deinococcus humi]
MNSLLVDVGLCVPTEENSVERSGWHWDGAHTLTCGLICTLFRFCAAGVMGSRRPGAAQAGKMGPGLWQLNIKGHKGPFRRLACAGSGGFV